MWSASWSTDISYFYHSDINLFLTDDAWCKLYNIWFLLCENNSRSITIQELKGATKLYFTHYSCVFIILFNTDLCRIAFSTISFGKLVFRLFELWIFNFFNQMLWTKVLKYMLSCYAIFLCNFVMWPCSHFIKTHPIKTVCKNAIA